MKRTVLALCLVACACSSKNQTSPADAGASDASAADAGPDVPEPPWSGTTVEPGCTVNGCVRELTRMQSYDKTLLAAAAAPGIVVENGVVSYFVRYWSDGDEITGTVLVPDSAVPAGGWPVVLMNQFTSGIGDPCSPSKGLLGVATGSPTALRGILTLVPDAPSYGPPPIGVYLAAKQAGRAALDGVRAAFHLGQALGVPIARKAVVAGLSQGGHSTMSTAAELLSYAPHLEVRGFAAAAPPANFLNGANEAFKTSSGFGVFLAMRMWTWQRYYQLGGDPVFKEPYASQAEGWFSSECIFNGATGKQGTLASHFPSDPTQVVSDAYLAMGRSGDWSPGWMEAYASSTPIPVGQVPPIVIFQGSADTTVPQKDTDTYVAQLRAAGVNVDYRVIPGGEHSTTALSSFSVEQLANEQAVQWIRDRLAP